MNSTWLTGRYEDAAGERRFGPIRIFRGDAMRRWRLINRSRRGRDPRARGRAFLVLEELEGREVLSPVVTPPFFGTPPQTLEGETRAFPEVSEGTFSVADSDTPTATYPVVATLSSTRGTFLVDESLAEDFGIDVAGNNTGTVTLSGRIDFLDAFLAFGFEFTPTDHYSGDAGIRLDVADLGTPPESGSGSFVLRVIPVASDANLTWATDEEVRVRTEPFAFPPGFLAVSDWPDADGSETFSVTLSLDADPDRDDPQNPDRTDEFTLSANGVTLATAGEPGLWFLQGTNPAAFQALLDSLVLTPPAGYSGRVGITAFGSIDDAATYSAGPPRSDTAFFGAGSVSLRFFEAATFTTPPVFVLEGSGPIDLGGRYAVDDPAELDEDSHSLTLSVPRGTLTFDPAAVPVGLSAGRDGNTILLTGDLNAINQFLATPGGLTYSTDDPFYSGRIPLTLTLINHPGEQFKFPSGPPSLVIGGGGSFSPGSLAGLEVADTPPPSVAVAEVLVVPVAGQVFASANDAVTNQDTPVALVMSVSSGFDADGSESVLVTLDGVPAGAGFDRGTNLGGGQWGFTAADLAGLVFIPPPGATGTYRMTMRAVVTDNAPELGLSDTQTDSTAFAVVVNPAPVVTPIPLVVLPPDLDTDDEFATVVTEPIVVDGIGDEITADEDEADDLDTRADEPAAFAGNTGSGDPDPGRGGTESAVELSAPAPGSLFGPADAPLPNYAYDDKHPLPPVAPLDQTNPVAVYTDSGGDSFALVEKFYRDANPADAAPPLGTAIGQAIGLAFPPRPVAATVPDATQPTPEPEPAPAHPEVEQVAAAPAETEASDWYAYAAAGAAVGVLSAWFGRGWISVFARYVRRLLHTTIRLQPKKPT